MIAFRCVYPGTFQLLLTGFLLKVFTEPFPCEFAVFFSKSGLLTAHLPATGQVFEIDTGRSLVDFLPAATRSENEPFLKVLLPDSELLHSLGERVHVDSMMVGK